MVNRCNGDRGHKIRIRQNSNIYTGQKNISLEEIYKLTNLAENYTINELVDNSLSKNSRRTSEIINESNYRSEDSILILRTFLQKAKRLLKLYDSQSQI